MVNDKDFDKIRPADVDLTRPAAPPPRDSGSGRDGNGRWLAAAFIAALLAIVAVVFILPSYVSGPSVDDQGPETIPSRPRTVDESPFEQAQLARARREAQDVLSRLLDRQEALEAKQVSLWAGERFDQAMATAAEGDKHYRQRAFNAALDHYREADKALAQLESRADEVVEEAIAAGRQALEAGEAEAAKEAYDRALAIEPDNSDARGGRDRAEVLPEALALLEKADAERENGDMEAARGLYRQALEVDPENTVAEKALNAVEEEILERDFNAAMSRGFNALEAGKADTAEKAFQQALKLKPDHADALSGRNQARNLQQQQWTSRQLERASRLEEEEKWSEAVDLYQTILDRDDSVMDARIGLIRARARAELDAGLEKALSDPLRLSTPAVANHARQLLEDARAIADPGPRLRRQTDRLAQALETAATPVTVTLRSNNKTRVTLLRVAELGTFESKQLKLKPGRYVAVGTREGYRDVRVEFQVDGSGGQEIVVASREPV